MEQPPADRQYTREHEWVKVDGDVATVGITDFAQRELGDVTYVELPKVGQALNQGEAFGVVESVKAVSDVYAPVSGEVIAVNEDLERRPEAVNASPYDEAWIVKVRLSDAGQLDALLGADEYARHVESESH